MTNYSETLRLPKSNFAMRLDKAYESTFISTMGNTYKELRNSFRRHEMAITLHDGPPYANGHIHIGHALNKILKDTVVRTMNMFGVNSSYVPGWDCHGLPIEWKVEEGLIAQGLSKASVPVVEFREACRRYAKDWLDVQREEFKNLGVMADWDNRYATMDFNSEGVIAEEALKFVEKGLVYNSLRPVAWSVVEKTALAEAEIEYKKKKSLSVWVRFKYSPKIDVLVWTTTPWTLISNQAIAFNENMSYSVYEADNEKWLLMADDAVERVNKATSKVWTKVDMTGRIGVNTPIDFGVAAYSTPWSTSTNLFFHADWVSAESGSGFVHLAPDHGMDDYNLCMKHKDEFASVLLNYVDDNGMLRADLPIVGGEYVFSRSGGVGSASKKMIDYLKVTNILVAEELYEHDYPHSWRSKTPLLYRATPQWFIKLDNKFRADLLNEIDKTKFVPETGKTRLADMIKTRPDWLISRQRSWGVPLMILLDKNTKEVLIDPMLNKAIVGVTKLFGADWWFEDTTRDDILRSNGIDPALYEPIMDVLDVWFDSGCTHAFVKPAGSVIYLEGTDQHRGWFQSSLLESVGSKGKAPFDTVITHGFVLDDKGRKMSKSEGNVISPEDIVKQHNTDVLRLVLLGSNYSDDIRVGPNVIKGSVEIYRKYRNTFKWLVGILTPLNKLPAVQEHEFGWLDTQALRLSAAFCKNAEEAHHNYDFRNVISLANQFVGEISSYYFDARKDVLYCDDENSVARQQCLYTLWHIYEALVTVLAPIVPILTQEVWDSFKTSSQDSVHLLMFSRQYRYDTQDNISWEAARNIRADFMVKFEEGKANGLTNLLDISVDYYGPTRETLLLNSNRIPSDDDMRDFLGVSSFVYHESDIEDIQLVVCPWEKCERSRKRHWTVGTDTEYPTLSKRDADVMRSFAEKVTNEA